MVALDANPAVIAFTAAGVIAAVYAFICDVRGERVARAAVRRFRETHPPAWQGMHWFYRRVANSAITIRVLRSRYAVSDPDLEQSFDLLKRLERQKLMALGVAFLCVALTLIGTDFWGWAWD